IAQETEGRSEAKRSGGPKLRNEVEQFDLEMISYEKFAADYQEPRNLLTDEPSDIYNAFFGTCQEEHCKQPRNEIDMSNRRERSPKGEGPVSCAIATETEGRSEAKRSGGAKLRNEMEQFEQFEGETKGRVESILDVTFKEEHGRADSTLA